jgi:hypothetical protein
MEKVVGKPISQLLSPDFRFGFLADIDYTSNRLRWSRFFILQCSSGGNDWLYQ